MRSTASSPLDGGATSVKTPMWREAPRALDARKRAGTARLEGGATVRRRNELVGHARGGVTKRVASAIAALAGLFVFATPVPGFAVTDPQTVTMTAPYADAQTNSSCQEAGTDIPQCLRYFAAADKDSGNVAVSVAVAHPTSCTLCVAVPFSSTATADAWVVARHDLTDAASAVDYAATVALDSVSHAEHAPDGWGQANAWAYLSGHAQHATCASCAGGAVEIIPSPHTGDITLRFALTNGTGDPIPPGSITVSTTLSAYAAIDGYWETSAEASLDAAWQVTSIVASVQSAPDGTPPDTTISAAPPPLTSARDATFEFASDEYGSTFGCRIDAGSFSPCSSPTTYSDLPDGTHTFEVAATDRAGNTDASPSAWQWTIDATTPETHITSGPPELTNQSVASFSFAASETGSSFECRLDGASFASCASPKSYSGLADGSHTFDVRSVDSAGNVDTTPALRSWTIDTTAPPPPTLVAPTNGSSTTDSTPAFDWSDVSDAAGVTYQLQVDNGGNTFPSPDLDQDGLSTSTYTPASGLSPGTYSWRVRALDAAANAGPWTSAFTVTVTAVPGSIAGSVTSQASKKPLAGAVVDCGGAGTAEASSDGTYVIASAAPGTYTCTASASEHRQLSKTVTVSSNTTTTANFVLRKG